MSETICGARIALLAAERQIVRQADTILLLTARLREAGLSFEIHPDEKAVLGGKQK